MKLSLKAARVNAGYTQAVFAKMVGVTTKTVGSWENGMTQPTIDKIEAICGVLGRKYDEIAWKR